MDEDLTPIHESVHVYYRNRVSDLEWELAQSRALIEAKDRAITELNTLLDASTNPVS